MSEKNTTTETPETREIFKLQIFKDENGVISVTSRMFENIAVIELLGALEYEKQRLANQVFNSLTTRPNAN